MRCWRYGMPSSARPSRCPIRCAKSASAARCRSRPSQKHRNDATLLPRNQPRHDKLGGRLLKEGDIVNIDVTFIVEGWYGDSSRMYAVGPVARKAARLIEVTYEAMMRGIAAVKPGATTGDIGHAIQGFVEPQGMSVVRDFCGHGLGRMFHDEPNIIHIGRPGEGVTLKPGMFFTIEPMINLGKPHVKILSDGWTAVTRDRSLSAQFEHSVGVTQTGVEIFTLSQRNHEKPLIP